MSGGQGRQACASFGRVSGPELDRSKRQPDTAVSAPRASRRSSVIVDADAIDDLTCKHPTSTSSMPTMPGSRISAPATRTTTARTTRIRSEPSANDFPYCSIVTVPQLFEAYRDCRRRKRNTRAARSFEIDQEDLLMDLFERLRAGTWFPAASSVFVVKCPKPREVWAAQFQDRIVHHLVYNAIKSLFEPSFLADCCASIKGRGTLYAANRLEGHLRSATENWTRKAFILKADIASFFPSIRHDVLLALLERRIKDETMMELCRRIIQQDVTAAAEVRCPQEDLDLIPARKSLYHAPPGVGLPIGNLSSQFFANVLLDPLDQMIRRQLGIRHSVRYVDDMVLAHRDPKVLLAAADAIRAYLAWIGLELAESKTFVAPVEHGIDFVGHVIRPHRHSGRPKTHRVAVRRVLEVPAADLIVTTNSYLGLYRHVGSFQQRIEIARAGRNRGLRFDRKLTKATGRLPPAPKEEA